MSFYAELKRRNVFKVAIVYFAVAWLLLQVSDTLGPALHLPEWFVSAVAFLLILGFPIAVILAWAFDLTPEGLKKEKDVDRGASISATRLAGASGCGMAGGTAAARATGSPPSTGPLTVSGVTSST